MEQDILISVIMPVYKVEDYVGASIESMQAQTYKNFEFLIVDDGTPDRSGDICEEYAKNDPRIKVFHKENGGAPSARNYAMDRAQGKYYYFMDSDDTAEPTMLADMLEVAERDQAELVVTGFYIDTYYNDTEFFQQKQYVDSISYPDQKSFREDAYRLFDKNLLYSPWNKLWLRSYIEERGLRFPGTFWDDFPFVLSVIHDVQKVSVIGNAYYHFVRKRAESETAAYRPDMYDKREEEHGWMRELYEHWCVYTPESIEMVARRYIERFIGCLENITNDRCELSKAWKKKQIKKMLENPSVDWSLEYAKPRSLIMKIMLLPIRWKNVWMTYTMCRRISKVKSTNTKRFAKLKANR